MRRVTHAAAIALACSTAVMSAPALPVSSEAPPPLVRIWTNTRGVKLLARLEKVSDGKAYLRRTDGKLVAVAVDRLAVVDRMWVVGMGPAVARAMADKQGQRVTGEKAEVPPKPPRAPKTVAAAKAAKPVANGFRFDGSSVYKGCNPVSSWSEKSNVVWKTELPWWGHGQGCLAKGRLFLTCEPREGIVGIQLLCIDAHAGTILWTRDVQMFDLFPEHEVSADRAAWLKDRKLEHDIHRAARELAELRPYLLAAENPTNAVTSHRDQARKLRERWKKQYQVVGGPRTGAWMYAALAGRLETIAATLEKDTPKTVAKRVAVLDMWKRQADRLNIPYGFTAERAQGILTDRSKPNAFQFNMSYMTPSFQRTDAQQEFRIRMSRDYGLYYNDWAQSGALAGRTGYGSIGTAFPTPVTDGEFVYVWTGNNVAACYDTDGHCKWLRWFGPLPRKCGASFLSSPILADGKVILFDCAARMGMAMRALDRATGRTLWERGPAPRVASGNPTIGEHHGTPAVVTLGKTAVLFAPDATVTRISDGKLLGCVGEATGAWMSGWCSPAAGAGGPGDDTAVVYFVNGGSGGGGSAVPAGRPPAGSLLAVQLTLEDDAVKGNRLWVSKTEMSKGSQLVYHDGLLYADTLVIDPANGEILRKLPVWDYVRIKRERVRRSYAKGSAHILPIAGGRLYHLNSEGLCMVFETGRTNALVSINALGPPEHVFDNRGRPGHEFCYGASPWFSGNRMFIRSPFHLYCIGKPATPTSLTAGQDVLPPPAGPPPVPASLKHATVEALLKLIGTGRSGNVIAATREIRRRLGLASDPETRNLIPETVAPALLPALTLNHMEQRREIARTLAALGPAAKPAVPVLQGLLTNDDPMIRIQAMEALATLTPVVTADALPVLLKGLSDTAEPKSIRAGEAQAFRPPSVRDWAVIGLAAAGKQATNAIPPLLAMVEKLEDWEWNWDNGTGTRLHRRLVSALAATGAGDALCDQLEASQSDSQRAAILMALGRIRPVSRRSVSLALRTRGRNVWKIRGQVFEAMGPGAAAGLVTALKNRTYGVPQAAADYLVKIGDPALPELAMHAEDKAIAARVKAITARVKVRAKGPAGIPELVKYLKDPRPETRRWALDTIKGYGVRALPMLRTMVNDETMRPQTIEIIEHIAGAGKLAVPGLLDLIRASSALAKLSIADALTRRGEPMMLMLEPYMREPSVGTVATEVVQRVKLSNNRGPEAIPALIAYLRHPSTETQRWASSQLRIRGKASISELVKHENDPAIGKMVKKIMRAVDPTRK
ncbi:HEAT repeat domain-containing protein [Verrucomicrobiota bacterium]